MTVDASSSSTSADPAQPWPWVSVIVVPGPGGQASAGRLEAFARQTHRNFECLVMRRTDSDVAAALPDERFRVVCIDAHASEMQACCIGLDASRAPWVAFAWPGPTWPPDALERLLGAHALAQDHAGRLLLRSERDVTSDDSDALSRFRYMPGTEQVGPWHPSEAQLFRRSALEALRPLPGELIPDPTYLYWSWGAHLLDGTLVVTPAPSSLASRPPHECDVDLPSIADVRAALAKRVCEVANGRDDVAYERARAAALVAQLGWRRALRLHDTDASARQLLREWAKPWRRALVWGARRLPRSLRPRGVLLRGHGPQAPEGARRPGTLRRALRRLRLRLPISAGRFVQSAHGPWLLDTPGDRTFELCVAGNGRLVADAIRQYASPFSFVDIGANCGVFSLLAAAQPSCRDVVAIEPVADTFLRLRANVARNGAAKIRIVRAAVLDQHAGVAHLTYDARHSGLSAVTSRGGRATVRAPVLDAEALERLVRPPGLPVMVKIDVEGGEAGVLTALARTSWFPAVTDVLVELSERHAGVEGVGATRALLERAGFHEVARDGTAEHYDAHFRR